MSRKIDTSGPLNKADRDYMLSRGREMELARIDSTPVDEVDEVDEADEVVPYEDMTVDMLKAEIESRNAENGPDEQIAPKGKNKADLIAALEEDDEAHV